MNNKILKKKNFELTFFFFFYIFIRYKRRRPGLGVHPLGRGYCKMYNIPYVGRGALPIPFTARPHIILYYNIIFTIDL